MFFSPVPMIQDFGYTLIIGVIAAYFLAMYLLVSILCWNDRRKGTRAPKASKARKQDSKKEGEGIAERLLRRLAPRVINNPIIILPIALVLCAVGWFVDGRITTETDFMMYFSSDLDTVQNLRTLEGVTGGRSSANLLLEGDSVTEPETLDWMMQLQGRITSEQSDLVSSTNSVAGLVVQSNAGQMPSSSEEVEIILDAVPAPLKTNLITDDFRSANIEVNVGGLSEGEIEDLKVAVTGSVILQDATIEGLTGGRLKITFIGIGSVFVGLFLLFRFRIRRALMALLPIALIIGWSALVMFLAGIEYTPVTATLGALIIGIGVEFTILLMNRYYEEREKQQGPAEAMTTAMTKIGRAVIASGKTTVGGFAALLTARDFPILVDFGIVTQVNIVFALVSTLFVLPPLIVWLDTKLERRRPVTPR